MLPESKRFPIEFELARAARPTATVAVAEAAPVVFAEPEELLPRICAAANLRCVGQPGRWLVEAAAGKQVAVARVGGLLRFTIAAGEAPAETAYADLLRRNAGFVAGGYGLVGPQLVLTTTLLESTADDEEVLLALRSLAAGGEPVRIAPVGGFDRAGYKLEESPFEESIVRTALVASGIEAKMTGPARGDCLVRLDGGRTQRVALFFDRADVEGRQVIQMVSVCGPAAPAHFRAAMTGNPTLAFASVGLAKIGAEENLVVTRCQLAKTADAEEVLIAVTTLAQVGDRIESQITGGEDKR